MSSGIEQAHPGGMLLKDMVVVITGGAGFLGRQFSFAVAEQGGVAVVADINVEAAHQVVREIEAIYPGHAFATGLDITDRTSVQELIKTLDGQYGRVDAVVNNAYPRNSNYGRKLEEVSYADFCENMNLHLGGYFLVAQQFGLYFRQRGGGSIINMSSIYGVMAPRFEVYAGTSMTMPVEYAAIKSAVVHLTRYFAQYYKADGVRVNCISPGGILDRQPEQFLQAYNSYCGTKGMLAPQDISGTLVFLLSDVARYMTGQNLVVDDGFSL